MYCKKCKYNSYDHVKSCPKCGSNWEEDRKLLHLNWISSSGHQWLGTTSKVQAVPEINMPEPSELEITMPTAPRPQDQFHQSVDLADKDEPIVLDLPQGPEVPFPNTSEPTSAAHAFPEIAVASLPDLDFSSQYTKEDPVLDLKLQAKDNEFFVDNTFGEEDEDTLVELDFGASFDELEVEPEPARPVQAKREDLFIPELEEMLAPLTDESTASSPSNKTGQLFFGEGEILLDFGTADTKDSDSDVSGVDVDFLAKKS